MPHTADVNAAADQAVKKVFYLLGVDVDSAESVEDFRADLRFGRRLRKLADHGAMGLVGVLVVGFAAAVWHGIVASVKVTR